MTTNHNVAAYQIPKRKTKIIREKLLWLTDTGGSAKFDNKMSSTATNFPPYSFLLSKDYLGKVGGRNYI